MTSTATTEITFNPWTDSRGNVRMYANGWQEAMGLDIDYYKTGNIRGAAFAGQDMSNRRAGMFKAAKAWVDGDGKVHLDHWSDRIEVVTAQEVVAFVAKAYANRQAGQVQA